ncbi:phage repressor protein C with HTH and peptisase S24 domain [Nitrospina gracilis]|uniref:XRE family transcriptional regulator n=1 Tax=Nitrospina TaxID=35800 RepID=UPI00034D2F9C|nr:MULTISPECIES: helix-turn-helix transcriptional regulator [Nitrospina]MCF8722595.1 phage repressor protein C with HTH and peptisase S24 domain [Nitrospina sp. Nb-3]
MAAQYKKIDLKEVGQRIRSLRGSLSQLAFARKLNVHQVDISRLERGETVNPSPELLLNICRLQEPTVSLEWLVSGEGPKVKDSVQKNEGRVSAAEEEFLRLSDVYRNASPNFKASLDHREMVDHLAFKKKWLQETLQVQEDGLVLIEAISDSMEPTLSPGDLLLIDGSVNYIRDDGIYCLRTPREEVLLKRLQRLPGEGLAVKSDNPKYEQFILSEEDIPRYAIIGPVIWIGRRF